jgi:peptidoglycan/LPS O-acetylase OafA/YrhL
MQGVIRLYLALCVVHAHVTYYGQTSDVGGPIEWMVISSAHAVMCFFVISGFFAFFQLDRYFTTRAGIDLAGYYRDRLIRLYPTLLVVLAIGTPIYVLLAPWAPTSWSPATVARVTGANLFPPALVAALMAGYPAFDWMPIPPLWSNGNEMLFYAAAPALLLLWRRSLGALLAALAVTIAYAELVPARSVIAGYVDPIANARFFILGAIGYLLWQKLAQHVRPSLGWLPLALAVLFCGGHLLAPHVVALLGWEADLFFVAFAAFLVATFLLVPKSAADIWLGNLSYPLFLAHVPMILLARTSGLSGAALYLLCLTFSFAAAITIHVTVDGRIERWRKSRRDTPNPHPLLGDLPAASKSAL